MEKFLICEGSVMTIDRSLSLAVFVFNVYVCTLKGRNSLKTTCNWRKRLLFYRIAYPASVRMVIFIGESADMAATGKALVLDGRLACETEKS